MNANQWMKTMTIAAALATAPVAMAQTTTVQTRPMPDHGYGATVSGTVGTPYAVPAQPDDLDLWMQDHALRNDGRISREAYQDEMGRRWDAVDANRSGLTPADVSRLTGRVDSNAPAPLTGTGVQPGNMGPGNSKGK